MTGNACAFVALFRAFTALLDIGSDEHADQLLNVMYVLRHKLSEAELAEVRKEMYG